jgi:hypothetical protein
VFQCHIRYRPSVSFRQFCRFCFFTCLDCLIVIATSFPHFPSDLPLPFLSSDRQVNITFCHLLPPTHNTLPYHLTSYFQFLPSLFLFLPFFSNSFLIFNILHVYFAAPFQKSLSGLNRFFLQSVIHCPNFTTAVYVAFHHTVKY